MIHAQARITSSNKTPLVQIFVWIPIAISALGVCARLGTKLAIWKKLEWQDHFITISLASQEGLIKYGIAVLTFGLKIFSIGQSVAVAIECANGLGQFLETISEEQLEKLLKAEYAAGLLYFTSLFFAKMSIVMFIEDLTPIQAERIATKVLGAVIFLWAVTSIFATAFQCRLPKVWDNITGECFAQKLFSNFSAVVNIITDASLVLLVTFIALHIRTTWSRKLTLICVFGTRICVIAAVSFQLLYSNQRISDPTFDPWPTTISNQAVQCLSIVTTCVPYLKPFLDSLESGLIRTDDLRRRGGISVDEYHGFKSNISHNQGSKISKMGKRISQKLSWKSRHHSKSHELSDIVPAISVSRSNTVIIDDEGHLWDGQSQSSQARIIKESHT